MIHTTPRQTHMLNAQGLHRSTYLNALHRKSVTKEPGRGQDASQRSL